LKKDHALGHLAKDGWATAQAQMLERRKTIPNPAKLSGKDSMLCGAIAGFVARIVVAPCEYACQKRREALPFASLDKHKMCHTRGNSIMQKNCMQGSWSEDSIQVCANYVPLNVEIYQWT
jgi:hypothetical protein